MPSALLTMQRLARALPALPRTLTTTAASASVNTRTLATAPAASAAGTSTGTSSPFSLRPVVPKTLDPATHRVGTRPAPRIKEPAEFLRRIGRGMEGKLAAESWAELWRMDGAAMKKAGLSVRDRRYVLWCMEKYRLGFPIEEFAHEPPPKKTIRGWGPKVQNGKRIRSRRIKDKTKKAKLGSTSRPISLQAQA